jgi:hypothetical protein
MKDVKYLKIVSGAWTRPWFAFFLKLLRLEREREREREARLITVMHKRSLVPCEPYPRAIEESMCMPKQQSTYESMMIDTKKTSCCR